MGELVKKDALDNEVIITPLRKIFHHQGDIYHGIKKSEANCFTEFGEAYFTTVYCGQTKGWKKHTRMRMNLIVPTGEVEFFIYDENTNKTKSVILGEDNYLRLTIPPGLWVAFRGKKEALNLILNVASLEHDPDEAKNVPLGTFGL